MTMRTDNKLVLAVFFGGPGVEHDVSVLTGLQILDGLDPARYDAFPVYWGLDGVWRVGEALRERRNYLPNDAMRRTLDEIRLAVGGPQARPCLESTKRSLLGARRHYEFDLAIPAFHGDLGEGGAFQGLLDCAGIPYIGSPVAPCAVALNKMMAKTLFKGLGVPTLPGQLIQRPAPERMQDMPQLAQSLSVPYPVCIKPNNLGSSVGVTRAQNAQQALAGLQQVFRLDTAALIEPFVEDLVEYNLAVMRGSDGQILYSAIERPLRASEVLDFKDKYLSGGDLDSKLAAPMDMGMASATREFHPKALPEDKAQTLRIWAGRIFEGLEARGTIRIDFIGHAGTGELWANEVNICPGSLAYYLWEQAQPRLLLRDLLTQLVEQARIDARQAHRVTDPAQAASAIFRRK